MQQLGKVDQPKGLTGKSPERCGLEAARPGGAQREEEDDAAADGHDAHLAADYGQGQGFLVGLGEVLVVGFSYLALGGVGSGALGDEGDEEGEDAVEVVEAFLGLVVGDDEEAAEEGLDEDGNLGRSQQVPEGDRGLVAVPGDAADEARGRI